MAERPRCRHCPRRACRPRGLCSVCYEVPAIRAMYARRPSRRKCDGPEPTGAELDALIAEQMKNLPAWWTDEARAFREGRSE